MTSYARSQTKPHPWWLELLLVDFRHAFWPWVVYLILILTVTLNLDPTLIIFLLIINYGVIPAIVTRTFATDHYYGTIQYLLSFPRTRSSIFLGRFVLLVTLLIMPMIPYVLIDPYRGGVLGQLLYMIGCQLSFGILLSVKIRKPITAWSAAFVMPMILGVVIVAVVSLANLNVNQNHITSGLIITSAPVLLLAYRQWLRLEVRS